jgi:hypothetical protein
MTTNDFTLSRDSFGHLTLIAADGQAYDDVAPVRSFPIQSPDEGISLICTDGREVAWIPRLADLPDPTRRLIDEELESHEFMPKIQSIAHITGYATPCTWRVVTDRGETDLLLRSEEDIRRIGHSTLLVADNHGIHFLIQDMTLLNNHSRKILDRFL